MTDKQLLVFYVVFIGLMVLISALVGGAMHKPMDAQAYADKLCQELYGPQTGATWEKGTLMCETARGEIIEVRRVK
jgi:hypothetical protein